jgi:phosphonate transport system ATP-binding protein
MSAVTAMNRTESTSPVGDAPMATVRLAQVTKRFGGPSPVTALDAVDLSVKSGEFCALIGLSGSGKSTLLRHLNGLQKPDDGIVSVLGVDVSQARGAELRALRRRVGFVFQQFNLVLRASVMDNVLTGALGRVRGPRYGSLTYSRTLRAEAAELLDRVGLGDRLFQRAGTLSGGQQQRVGIARMLMQRPELVLADEPVASLDPEASRSVMDLLTKVCREDNLTVICSLHQLDLALDYSSRIVGLRNGVKVLDRPSSEIDSDEAMKVYRQVGATDEEVALLDLSLSQREPEFTAASGVA